ncbi:hypothetical protein HDU87_002993 [Geranomyces variabilis]|uniref:Reverse transcriptase Ty1/copia-type domain-containing protein n=1 Tax=Geranomyces variabilis TaxID=109894 RepID=A0AAD5XRS9_9FUNG|nr:hypothetical protein HDU87_002993 [Geranomyces variabilis]
MIPTNANPCLYVRKNGEGFFAVVVYVDDILIIAEKLDEIDSFKAQMSKEFKMSDLGKANVFLYPRVAVLPMDPMLADLFTAEGVLAQSALTEDAERMFSRRNPPYSRRPVSRR